MMSGSDDWSFEGEVLWLTADQGGRARSEVPPCGTEFAGFTARVPPRTAKASFLLRRWESGAWKSPAEGRWLGVANEGEWALEPGSVVPLHEGRTTVAIFFVTAVSLDRR